LDRALVVDQHRNPAVFHRNTEHPQKYQVLGAGVPGGRQMPDAIVLARAVKRAKWRLVPFLILMYMLAYLDRVNIGFAKQAYQAATGVSDLAFAFGAGAFFLTYAVFEIPSNLLMYKFGARRWMARIMVTWGLVAAAMMFATHDASFSVIRMFLGAVEAGFFPGCILYLTYWFPARERAQIMAIFYFGSPLALMFGGPISGLLLDLNGLFGLQGWQLMFLIQGLASSAVGIWAYFYLCDRPGDASWMPAEERRELVRVLNAEEREKQVAGEVTFLSALRDWRLIHFAAIYFLIQITGLGVAFYLPTQVGALLGVKVGLLVGFVSAIPWACAIVAGSFYPGIAARTGMRRTFGVISLLGIGFGLIVSAHGSPLISIIALCFVTMGIMTAQPIFWTFPTSYLGGTAAAGGFALINSVGALGGFVAPNLRTGAETFFHSPVAGLYGIAAAAFLAVVLFILLPKSHPAHTQLYVTDEPVRT
jgi:MFS family permease